MGWKVAYPSFGIELPKASAMCWVCCLSWFYVAWCKKCIFNKSICWSHVFGKRCWIAGTMSCCFFTWYLLMAKWCLSSFRIAAPGFVGDDHQNSLWYRIISSRRAAAARIWANTISAQQHSKVLISQGWRCKLCWFEHEIRCGSFLRASESRHSSTNSGS